MNLNNIFSLNLLNLGDKFDHIYSLELMGVMKGFKKIAKLEPFTFDSLDRIKIKLNDLNLKYIYFEKDEYFDDKKMLFLKGNNKGERYIDLYISKSDKILNILEKINKLENIKEKNYLIGKLLGYPDCCIKSFLETEYTGDLNFNLRIKKNTKGNMDWRLNNLINPYSLIPFFPCSYNCVEAIKYAENNISIIGKREDIKSILKNIINYKGFWDYKIEKIKNDDSYFVFV